MMADGFSDSPAGRSENSIKNRYYASIRKQQRRVLRELEFASRLVSDRPAGAVPSSPSIADSNGSVDSVDESIN